MIPSKLPLTNFTAGDTWEGIPSLTITINGAAPAKALASVTMRFKKTGSKPSEVVELSSTGTSPKITITDAANWQIAIAPQIVTGLTAGSWTWRMRFTDADGVKQTYVADTITVLEDV